MVEPTTQRIRADLELREKIPGGVPCTGALVGDASDTFSFEAAHFIPEKDIWQGVFTAKPEKLINHHLGRSKSGALENSAKESFEDLEGAEDELFEVCVVKSGICVATLARPPLRSVFDTFGMFTLRERTPQINSYISWMCAIFVIFLVVVLVIVMFVHFLLDRLYRSGENAPPSAAEQDEDDFAAKVVPTSYEVIMQVVVSLSRMALAASTLIVVCCCFVFKREVDPWDGRIMSWYPLILMFVHMVTVMGACFKTLLYNSLLRDKLHIVFRDHGSVGIVTSPLWITVFGATAIFLYTGMTTLLSDARTGSCVAENSSSGDHCSKLQIFVYVGIGFWGLLFPVAYCIWLIYSDFAFEMSFMPLYKIFNLDVDGKDAEAPGYLGKLMSVTYNEFITAGHAVYMKDGVYGVEPKAIIKELKDMEEKAEGKRSDSGAGFSKFEDGTTRWAAESLSMWSWRLRMRHSTNKALELRLLLIVVTAAFAWTILAAFGASVYRQMCIPSLEEVTPSIGQLSPEFNQYVFNYNIFVDNHIKSAGLEVIAEKKFTATTAFHIPGLSKDPQTDPWIKKSKNVHVPFLVRNALMDRNASQAEELRASRRAPVPIELHVRGAGTTLVYRITVVKLETRVASLTYRYNTSRSVDEVVVHKNVDWEKVMPAEEVAAEKEAFADAETEGAAVYVPDDTKEVLIDMERELSIFGPTGGTVVKGFELAKFEAVRKLTLCPPKKGSSGCQRQEGSGSKVNLKKAVTALPVELHPNGTDPLRFFVSIIRISNRLINLEMEGAMGARASNGGEWASMAFLPAFRPLVDHYETFFEVPDSATHKDAMQNGTDDDEEWHTLFLRVLPQGNARSNWLEAELRPNSQGSDEDLELFCRPAGEDGADEPLDPTVEAATKDLSCSATEQEVDLAEMGKPTEELIIRSGERAFRNHFYVKYKYRLSDPKPFSLLLRVMFHDEVLEDANATETSIATGHRTYEVKFLPQAPMRLEFFAPLPRMEAPVLPQEPTLGAAFMSVTRSKRNLHMRNKDPIEPPGIADKNFGLPLFLSPPFSSDVLVYDAMVPPGSAGIRISLMGSHSLWVGSGDQPLEGLGRGSALVQEIDIRHRPNCGEDEFAPVAAPAPAVATRASSLLCPVSLRIFERRDGFPRSYGVRLREAPPDAVLLVGYLAEKQGARAVALPGFRPDMLLINSTFHELKWHWEQPVAAGPSPAAAAEWETISVTTVPPEDAPQGTPGPTEEKKESAQPTPEPKKAPVAEEPKDAPAAETVPAQPTDSSETSDKAEEVPIVTPAPTMSPEEQAKDSLSDVVNPVARPKMIPRQTEDEPTAAPRKMDEPLLPFFLQTASEPTHEPDGIFEAPSEDDQPLFAAPGLLPDYHKATIIKQGAPVITDTGTQPPEEAEAPLFATLFSDGVAGGAPAPAVAKATTPEPTTTPPPMPTEWETGEPVPTSTLAVLAGSPSADVSVQWNGVELPLGDREGAWFRFPMFGKILAEGCWCDRKQLGNVCKARLRKEAPLAVKRYYRSNKCQLRISVNGKLLHKIEVGLAGAASPALQERAMEEAADAADLAGQQAGGIKPMTANAPAAASTVEFHSADSELLIAP
jgi:hypothetical protein